MFLRSKVCPVCTRNTGSDITVRPIGHWNARGTSSMKRRRHLRSAAGAVLDFLDFPGKKNSSSATLATALGMSTAPGGTHFYFENRCSKMWKPCSWKLTREGLLRTTVSTGTRCRGTAPHGGTRCKGTVCITQSEPMGPFDLDTSSGGRGAAPGASTSPWCATCSCCTCFHLPAASRKTDLEGDTQRTHRAWFADSKFPFALKADRPCSRLCSVQKVLQRE